MPRILGEWTRVANTPPALSNDHHWFMNDPELITFIISRHGWQCSRKRCRQQETITCTHASSATSLTTSPLSEYLRYSANLVRYINNKLLWARKYARIVVRGYYLFREANSCPRASLSGNCSLLGTDNVQGQLFVHISSPKVVYCLYCPSNISSHSESSGAKTKQHQNTKQNTSTSWCFLALLSQQVF